MVVLQGASSAAAAGSSPETFARTAILAWANQILASTYAAFSDIPPHDLALILYGIFDDSHQGSAASSSTVSLQNIQFPPHYAASGSCSAARTATDDGLSRSVQERNAGHVLCIVHALSTQSGTAVALSPTTDPASWIDGKAFVDELRVWRWTRTVALERSVTVDAIRASVSRFLRGEKTHVCGQSAAPCATPESRDGIPLAGQKRSRDTDEACDTPQNSNSHNSKEGIMMGPAEAKQRRLDEETKTAHSVPPPMSLVEASRQRLQRAAAAATESRGAPLAASGYGTSCSQHATGLVRGQELAVHASAHEAETQVTRVEAVDAALRRGPHLVEEVVTKAGALAAAQSHRATVRDDDGATAAEIASIPQARPNETTAEAASPAVHIAGVVVPPGACQTCVPVVAQAIQAHLLRVEQLEDARQRALAACKCKDASALLSALSIVL